MTDAATTERMSRVDTAWLRMDSEANLMMIVGVWLLAPRLTLTELQQRIGEGLLAYPRFRQKVVEDAAGASWVTDVDFDIGHHVQREALHRHPGEAPLDALKRRVAELAASPLDPSRPLWQFALIEALDGEHSALVSRIHHCIGDGIALISVMLSIADGGKAPPPRKARAHPDEDSSDWLADSVIKPIADLAVKAIAMTGQGVGKGLEMFSQPGAPMASSLEAARIGLQLVSDVSALALMPDDSPTRLKGKATPGKRVAWGEPLPLDRVKAVGKVFHASINDVLLSCVAGAIGDYLRSKGDDPSGQHIRAMVPVNLRPLSEAHQLGNRFGLVPLVLPIGIANPIERLIAVRVRMADLKGSYQPLLTMGVLALSGLVVRPLQSAITGLFAKKATAVMTNVPGPKDPIRFCGRTVEQVMFWVPQSGDIGMGVSILSYAGGVQFGLITDAKMCPDPEAIIASFAPEFEKLLWLALMSPWPGEAHRA
ncbi:MAG TPA: wax ester/triacylglycerol synthase family O-acyltransferase [Burkholderiaceae bacterium]